MESRLAKNVNSLTSKEEEIKHFNSFYSSCAEGSYLKMFLDYAGMTPDAVKRAIDSDKASL